MKLSAILLVLISLGTTLGIHAAQAEDRKFEFVTIEADGVKFWVPSSITVKKGDTVKIHAVSKVPGESSIHGFAIDAYNVKQVADNKGGATIEFKADKAGIFPIYCQLHATHIPAQLVVLDQ